EDEDLKTVAAFHNLETLNLNNTTVTGSGFGNLTSLRRLRSVSVSGTDISASALQTLAKAPGLRDVYMWNTPVSGETVAALQKEFPHIRWNVGYVADENEILKLNTPMFGNKGHVLNDGEQVVLKHNLPGTEVRYTLDGSDPD